MVRTAAGGGLAGAPTLHFHRHDQGRVGLGRAVPPAYAYRLGNAFVYGFCILGDRLVVEDLVFLPVSPLKRNRLDDQLMKLFVRKPLQR